MFDIETLRIIWWLLIGVLIMGFALTDGFDLGAMVLLNFIAKNDTEKRIVLETFSPYWEGNQVWIILGAGAIFAAWPFVYAVAFSGAYFGVLLLLLTMGISRPVSIKYRNKLKSPAWRAFWDKILFIGGFFPSVILGILVGNVALGLPFYLDNDLRILYTGNFLQLFSPFALWCGLISLAMFTMHGGYYVAMKTLDPIRTRAMLWGRIGSSMLIVFFAIGGIWATFIVGYQVVGAIPHDGYSNPLHKQVIPVVGGWLINYAREPMIAIAPALGSGAALLAFLFTPFNRIAFLLSGLSIVGVIATVGVAMFPFILPSSTNYNSSLLVWDASSSQLTLFVMLFAVSIFLPLILIYTTWVYRMLRGKVTETTIENDEHTEQGSPNVY